MNFDDDVRKEYLLQMIGGDNSPLSNLVDLVDQNFITWLIIKGYAIPTPELVKPRPRSVFRANTPVYLTELGRLWLSNPDTPQADSDVALDASESVREGVGYGENMIAEDAGQAGYYASLIAEIARHDEEKKGWDATCLEWGNQLDAKNAEIARLQARVGELESSIDKATFYLKSYTKLAREGLNNNNHDVNEALRALTKID